MTDPKKDAELEKRIEEAVKRLRKVNNPDPKKAPKKSKKGIGKFVAIFALIAGAGTGLAINDDKTEATPLPAIEITEDVTEHKITHLDSSLSSIYNNSAPYARSAYDYGPYIAPVDRYSDMHSAYPGYYDHYYGPYNPPMR